MTNEEYMELAERVQAAHREYTVARRERDDVKARCDAKWREYRELSYELQQAGRARLGFL